MIFITVNIAYATLYVLPEFLVMLSGLFDNVLKRNLRTASYVPLSVFQQHICQCWRI